MNVFDPASSDRSYLSKVQNSRLEDATEPRVAILKLIIYICLKS